MSKFEACLIDARNTLAKQLRPSFGATDYNDAIVEIAKGEAHPGESVAAAQARLMAANDERMRVLYSAAYWAETHARRSS